MPTERVPKVLAVLFDYGLVLSAAPDPAVWARMQGVLGASETAFHEAYWHPRHAYDRGDLTNERYWADVAAQLGIHDLAPTRLRALVDADVALWTRPNQPMIDWAIALQRAGMRTGILSNLGDAMERGVLARCPWLRDFVHHTFSHRLGIAKPEAAIYAHAAEGLQTAPEHILFIDDRADNIQAAREAGMQAIQYSNHDSFLESMRQGGFGDLLEPATFV